MIKHKCEIYIFHIKKILLLRDELLLVLSFSNFPSWMMKVSVF